VSAPWPQLLAAASAIRRRLPGKLSSETQALLPLPHGRQSLRIIHQPKIPSDPMRDHMNLFLWYAQTIHQVLLGILRYTDHRGRPPGIVS